MPSGARRGHTRRGAGANDFSVNGDPRRRRGGPRPPPRARRGRRCAGEREEADEDPHLTQVLVEVVDRGPYCACKRARGRDSMEASSPRRRPRSAIVSPSRSRWTRVRRRCGTPRLEAAASSARRPDPPCERLRGGPDVAGLVEDRGHGGREIPAARERLEPQTELSAQLRRRRRPDRAAGVGRRAFARLQLARDEAAQPRGSGVCAERFELASRACRTTGWRRPSRRACPSAPAAGSRRGTTT